MPMATKMKSRAKLIIEYPFRQGRWSTTKVHLQTCNHDDGSLLFSLLPSLKRCAFSIKSAKIVGVMSAEPRGYGAGSGSPRDDPTKALQTPVLIGRSASAFQTFLAFLP